MNKALKDAVGFKRHHVVERIEFQKDFDTF